MNKFVKLLLLILICEGVGILGAFFTVSEIPIWYQGLNKPFFSPPNWIFGPVWTTLYALMGVSMFLILEKKIKKKDKETLIFLFCIQLVLNFLWSLIFFKFHLPYLAFLEIILLWGSIALLIQRFWKYSNLASILLIPYLLWVSFASLLNLFVALLN